MKTNITLEVSSYEIAFLIKMLQKEREQLVRLRDFEKSRTERLVFLKQLHNVDNVLEQLKRYQ